jgi:hypothetical protein
MRTMQGHDGGGAILGTQTQGRQSMEETIFNVGHEVFLRKR